MVAYRTLYVVLASRFTLSVVISTVCDTRSKYQSKDINPWMIVWTIGLLEEDREMGGKINPEDHC